MSFVYLMTDVGAVIWSILLKVQSSSKLSRGCGGGFLARTLKKYRIGPAFSLLALLWVLSKQGPLHGAAFMNHSHFEPLQCRIFENCFVRLDFCAVGYGMWR